LLPLGKAALIAGLILVVFSRGCDSVGNRGAARRRAKVEQVRSEFAEKWEREEIKRGLKLSADSYRNYEEVEKLTNARKQFEKERQEDREGLERGKWLDLESDARVAEANNVSQGYWREWLFLIGSLALVVGALTVAFAGAGGERIVCLIIVGLIVFSIYVGGMAWTGSIINNVKGGVGIPIR